MENILTAKLVKIACPHARLVVTLLPAIPAPHPSCSKAPHASKPAERATTLMITVFASNATLPAANASEDRSLNAQLAKKAG
jgi:hypothetical protein